MSKRKKKCHKNMQNKLNQMQKKKKMYKHMQKTMKEPFYY